MKVRQFQKVSVHTENALTLIELLVVIAVVAIISSLLLPTLARAKAKGHTIICANNAKQLQMAWMLYALDNDDQLAYNLGSTEILQLRKRGIQVNWANSLLNWELDPDNTNVLLNTEAALGNLVGHHERIFRCPSDRVVSAIQKQAGWFHRSRTYSMNAMVGDAGEFTTNGTNINNPSYRQFLKLSEFRSIHQIFVFIEEHPDSINDGYFVNKGKQREWTDLPASFHNGGANLSFVDGHVETRRWLVPSTRVPARPDVAGLPFHLGDDEEADFYWLMRRTSSYDHPED